MTGHNNATEQWSSQTKITNCGGPNKNSDTGVSKMNIINESISEDISASQAVECGEHVAT